MKRILRTQNKGGYYLNEIDVLFKIQKVAKALKSGDTKSMFAILESTRSFRRVSVPKSYHTALKIIRAEMGSKSTREINLFIVFGAFYYKNIYDVFKPEWHMRVQQEVRDFTKLKANVKQYFYFTLRDLIGNSDIDDFIKSNLVNTEIIKMFIREDISLIYLVLFDYFFDLFTDMESIWDIETKKYWSKYKVKYMAIKKFFGISDKNENIKQLKKEILEENGVELKISEIKMFLKRNNNINSKTSNSLLSKLRNKNYKINEINF